MSYLPKTRKIDGKNYRLHDDYLAKSKADGVALLLRGKGWAVRVVSIMGLYGVYKRR